MSPVSFDNPQKTRQALPHTTTVSGLDSCEPNNAQIRSLTGLRLEFSRGLGNEPALQGLLRVFKDYYPDIILGSTSTSRKSFAPVSSRLFVQPWMQLRAQS